MIKRIPYYGLTAVMCYVVSTLGLILLANRTFLVLMELSTILSTPVMLLLFIVIPDSKENYGQIKKNLSIVFMACCMVLTSITHFTNIALILPLQDIGMEIPTYLQVGQWPSALMAIDYLGWGFFLGLAFIMSSLSVKKEYRLLKNTLLVNGILCLLGLTGTVVINAACWYIAPCGYGIGTAVVCVELIFGEKYEKTRNL